MQTINQTRWYWPWHFHHLCFIWGWGEGFALQHLTPLYMMLLYSIVDETLSEHELARVDLILIIWIPDNANWKPDKMVLTLSLSSLMLHMRMRRRFCTPTLNTFVYDVTLLHSRWNSLRTWISTSRCYFDNLNTR